MHTKMMLLFVFFLCFRPNSNSTFGIDRKPGDSIGQEKYVLDWIRQVPKDVIPYSEDGPLVVRHLLSINRLGYLDNNRQILELFGWQSITWTDVRLAWEVKKFIEVDEVIVPIDLVWKPDIILVNSVEYPVDFPKARAQVTKNGTVKMRVPMEYRSSCRMPNYIGFGDRFTCILRLGSWNYDLLHIELQAEMDTAYMGSFEDVNRDWVILGTNCSVEPYEREGYPGISTIVYQIELEKKNSWL